MKKGTLSGKEFKLYQMHYKNLQREVFNKDKCLVDRLDRVASIYEHFMSNSPKTFCAKCKQTPISCYHINPEVTDPILKYCVDCAKSMKLNYTPCNFDGLRYSRTLFGLVMKKKEQNQTYYYQK